MSGVDAVSSAPNRKEKSSILGTTVKAGVAAGVGAGAGYGRYVYLGGREAESELRKALSLTEDQFVKENLPKLEADIRKITGITEDIVQEQLVSGEKALRETHYPTSKATAETVLPELKAAKIKNIAGGAVILAGLYLGYKGIKALIASKKST